MKRLLMVSTISRFLRDFLFPFAEHYREQGWQVDALTSRVDEFPECYDVYDHLWEVSWSRSPLSPHNFSKTPDIIRRIVTEQQYDLVHVHTPVAGFVTRYALRTLRATHGVKVIYTAHGFHFVPGGGPLQNSLFLTLEKLAGPWTDHLIVINSPDAAAARHHRLVPIERLWHFPGIGLDPDYYHPRAVPEALVRSLRAQFALPADALLLTVIAELIPRKRHIEVLNAFRQLSHPHAHLVFAGDGPLREKLTAYTRKHCLNERVHFIGFQQDIRPLLLNSTAAILASRQEGLPRCLMESLALGVPVIGTDIRGTHELLEEGAGILVPSGNTRLLAQAMHRMLEYPEEARRGTAVGQHRINVKYRLERVLALHDYLYAHALSDNVPATAMQDELAYALQGTHDVLANIAEPVESPWP